MLQNLINTALLGTDKIGFDLQSLPESIRMIVEKIPETDKEARFLKTVALVAFYQEAGMKPKRFTGELLRQSNQEEWTISSRKFNTILGNILETQYHVKNDLLELWIDKLIDNQQVASPQSVVVLLGLIENLPKKFRLKILKVIGKKGVHLLSLKTDISQWQTQTDEQIWTEGRLAERREFFINLRKENPQKALELLVTTWSQESLNDKLAFLEVIQHTFQREDTAFLESVLPEFLFKAKEKRTQTIIRAMLMGILMGVEDSEVSVNTQNALSLYFINEKSKGISGWIGKETKKLLIPNQEDNFLDITTMNNEYGLDISPDFALFITNQHYWISCFLQKLPINFWVSRLENKLEDTLKYLLSDEFCVKIENKKVASFLNPLIQNTVFFRDIEMAKVLLKLIQPQSHLPLLKILPDADKEQYLIENKQLSNLQALEACFGNWSGRWSANFSSKILKETYSSINERNTFVSDRVAVMMANFLDSSSVNFLKNAKVYPLSATPYYTNYWEKNFVDVLQKTFDIKRNLGVGG